VEVADRGNFPARVAVTGRHVADARPAPHEPDVRPAVDVAPQDVLVAVVVEVSETGDLPGVVDRPVGLVPADSRLRTRAAPPDHEVAGAVAPQDVALL